MKAQIQRLFRDFSADDFSGSTELARRALDILRQSALLHPKVDFEETASGLIRSQPSMAAVINRVDRARRELQSIQPASKESIIALFERLEREYALETEQTVSAAATRLKGLAEIAAYSRSSLVERALVRLSESGGRFEVVVSEGRPGLEGVTLAKTLADHSVPVTLCVDAALPGLIAGCGALALGADAVTDSRFSNKIGTAAMCRAAREAGVPVFVIASSDKYLPPHLEKHYQIIDRSPDEILKEPPKGVKIYHRLFEWCDNRLVEEFIKGK